MYVVVGLVMPYFEKEVGVQSVEPQRNIDRVDQEYKNGEGQDTIALLRVCGCGWVGDSQYL